MYLRAEIALAWAAAAVGVISVVSALTPSLASRSDFVRGVLPPGVPWAARLLALAFGIALVWLSRSLALRRRRAWQLAAATVAAIAIAHLAKGLDVEEAAAALALLAALVRYRKHFDAPGDPSASRPLYATVIALAAVGALALFMTMRGTLPDRLEDALGAVGILLAFRALHLWLRPVSARVRQSVEERRRARRLVDDYGSDSLAFFTLRRDKSYFFSPRGRAFLAYRVVGGAALVSGDPVGDEHDLDELLHAFRAFAHTRGWRIAILGGREAERTRYERLGLRAIKLGDEAVLHPDAFSLEGRAIRKVRQSVVRLQRQGYRLRVVRANAVDADLRRRLDEVSCVWRGKSAERGFGMAMDDLYAEPGVLFAVVERDDGHVGGFLHLVPTPPTGGYSLSTMRRRPDSPNGLMEFAVAETAAWAARTGSPELSLNFCVFADMLRTDGGPVALRAARTTLLGLDRLFQLERLIEFNRKFFPEWRPRYVCVERLSDLPLVGMAYLYVESLLVPPGPWTRRSNAVPH
jgi:lysyl-tRNA synthetase, class II